MARAASFTFGIPLISRAAARSWPTVERLLGLTLESLLAQTDPSFEVIIAGNDRAECIPSDPRITFVEVDWDPETPRPDNRDSGRKKERINELAKQRGGGLLMFVDADDWIDTRLVETARSVIGSEHVGGLVAGGLVTDFRSLRSLALPHPRVFDGDFHRICGSSTVLQLVPGHSDPIRRDPYQVLHEHHLWVETAADNELEIAWLPVLGNYIVNTSENHSEFHGPFTDWRRNLVDTLASEGDPFGETTAARFGLDLAVIESASAALAPQPSERT